jgi:hypothetical protein
MDVLACHFISCPHKFAATSLSTFLASCIHGQRLVVEGLCSFFTMAIPADDHSLPSILPLPPIEMPDSSSSSSPPSSRHTPEQDPSSLLGQSSTSLASQNSFTTALSSSPMNQSRTASPMYHPSLAPPQSLRHSISVDSFVRKEVPKINTRTKRTNTDLAMPVPVRHSLSPDYEPRAVKRSRRVSFSTDDDPSVTGDSDLELWPSSRRRPSLKAKEQQQPFIRPGELKLPPRMPILSTAPSSAREGYRRPHATTSMQFIPGRINPALPNMSGRARSGSLGVKARPTLINTQMLVSAFLLLSTVPFAEHATVKVFQ